MSKLYLLAALILIGCSTSLESARDARSPQTRSLSAHTTDRCESLDTWRTVLDTFAVGSATAAGAQGVPAILELGWSPQVRRGLAAAAISLGILSVSAAIARQRVDAAWVRECSGGSAGSPGSALGIGGAAGSGGSSPGTGGSGDGGTGSAK